MIMGASNHPDFAFSKTKQARGRATSAKDQAELELQQQIQVYHLVDIRDGYRCRLCGRRGSPRSSSLLDKLHHDHILERSLGGATSKENVCCLCATCHERKTQHLVEPEGNPEAGTLFFVMARAVALEIFRGRRIPAHVRLKETA